ncbi:nitric oxide synthase oxygenase [Pseudonocardia spirodelae]|uniref:nitric oxide synthase oxygenase n=1 Tax=Pseudonocardia spirodelae TaxID=3133431 RepID=UPI003BF5955A
MTTVEHGKNSHPAPAAPTRPVRRPPGFRPSPTPRSTTSTAPGAPSGPGTAGESAATRVVAVVPLVGPVEATTAVAPVRPAGPAVERATVATPLPERPTVAAPVPGRTGAPAEQQTAVNRVDGPGAATTLVRAPAPAGGCPVTGHGRSGGHPPPPGVADERDPAPVDPAVAEEFLRQVHAETDPGTTLTDRLRQVRAEIDRTGTWTQTTHELVFGARIAWRNSARCIGRLYWQSLQVRDLRHLHDPADVAQESVGHLRAATRGGKIRSTMTVFAPDAPGRPGPRIRNDQLVRYAGHRAPDGSVVGDPGQADFTDHVVGMGWPRPQPAGRFDVLPLLITGPDGRSRLFDVPPDAVHEVPLRHPEHPWFARLGLRWHSVPAISNMPLEIGGVVYPAAPFNGWYLDTEVGARNLADTDRYDLLPEIAKRLGLDTRSVRTMWRDRAMVELVRAVTYSFDADGVTMADHYSESERFLTFLAKEEAAGRRCPADWSWIVPPMSGSQTPVFHRYYDEPDPDLRPAFLEPHGLRPPAAQA